jgi:hypothetical protein
MGRILRRFSIVAFLALLPLNVVAQQAGTEAPCPRPPAGSLVRPPPHLFSHNGLLDVAFDYLTAVDDAGRTLFCFMTPDGKQSPTLHVKPGDTLNVTVTNRVPPAPAGSPAEVMSNSLNVCGDNIMTISSLNIHLPWHEHVARLSWR